MAENNDKKLTEKSDPPKCEEEPSQDDSDSMQAPDAITDGLTAELGSMTINDTQASGQDPYPQQERAAHLHGREWRTFVEEPLGEKSVRAVPGIGPAYEEKLKKKGITKACMLVGQFIYFGGDEKKYIDWLQSTKVYEGISNVHARSVFDGIKEWCEKHNIWTA